MDYGSMEDMEIVTCVVHICDPLFAHLVSIYLVIHFDGLDVFPLLNSLCEVHHAQRHLHLPDLEQDVGNGNLGRCIQQTYLVMLGESVIVKNCKY